MHRAFAASSVSSPYHSGCIESRRNRSADKLSPSLLRSKTPHPVIWRLALAFGNLAVLPPPAEPTTSRPLCPSILDCFQILDLPATQKCSYRRMHRKRCRINHVISQD